MATRNITFKKTNLGGNSGDYFISIDSPRTLIASNITRAQLEAGYTINDINTTHTVFIISSTASLCSNTAYVTIPFPFVLTLGAVTSASLAFSWVAYPTATSYKIYWRVSGGSWTSFELTGTSHVITGLTANTTYEVYVEAYYLTLLRGTSNYITQATSAADTTAPSIPTNVAGIGQGSNIPLYWDASTDNVAVTGYNIYRDNASHDTSGTNSYNDVFVVSNQNYTYKVRAFDAAGNYSNFSTPVTINSGI